MRSKVPPIVHQCHVVGTQDNISADNIAASNQSDTPRRDMGRGAAGEDTISLQKFLVDICTLLVNRCTATIRWWRSRELIDDWERKNKDGARVFRLKHIPTPLLAPGWSVDCDLVYALTEAQATLYIFHISLDKITFSLQWLHSLKQGQWPTFALARKGDRGGLVDVDTSKIAS